VHNRLVGDGSFLCYSFVLGCIPCCGGTALVGSLLFGGYFVFAWHLYTLEAWKHTLALSEVGGQPVTSYKKSRGNSTLLSTRLLRELALGTLVQSLHAQA